MSDPKDDVVLDSRAAEDTTKIFCHFQNILNIICGLLWAAFGVLCGCVFFVIAMEGFALTLGLTQAICFAVVLLLSIFALRSILKEKRFFTWKLVYCSGGISGVSLLHALVWPMLFPDIQTSFYFAYSNIACRFDLVGVLYSLLGGVVTLIFYYGLKIQESNDLTI